MAAITIDYSRVRNPELKKWLEEEFEQVLFDITTGHDHDGENSKTLPYPASVENGAVTTVKIAEGAVTATKLGPAAVTSTKILDGAVTTAKIGADAVTGANIADDAVDSEHIAADAIETEHLGALQVTTDKIAADAIDGTKLANNAVNSEHITAGSVDAAHMSANSIVAASIASNAVTTDKILNDNVTNDKLANMTRGTVKVGGAEDAPTDLAANTDGYILVGDGADVASVAVSGDVTLANTGAVAIGAGRVTTAMLAATTTPNAKAIVAAHEANIPVTGNGDLPLTIAAGAAETNALAVPTFAGQEIAIYADTVGAGGSRTVTVATAIDANGNNTILFDAAGEFVLLRGIKLGETFAWRVVASDGATVGPVT